MNYDTHALTSVRPSVKFALAWRVISELLRRHQAARDLRVSQFFPGLSVWGVLRVTAPHQNSGKPYAGLIDFNVGGAGIGGTSVDGRNLTRYSSLLEGMSSAKLVDEIEDAMGWPRTPSQPATPPSLTARVLARFLQQHMVSPTSYRLSPGGVDNASSYSGSEPNNWVLTSPEGRKVASMERLAAVQYVTRFWLLHEDRDQAPVSSWDRDEIGPAIMFNMATGQGIALHNGKRIHLMQRYAKHGRSVRPLVYELETLLGTR